MSADVTYDYVIVRVVPRVERGERVNVGVILSCVDSEVLQCRIEIDEARDCLPRWWRGRPPAPGASRTGARRARSEIVDAVPGP